MAKARTKKQPNLALSMQIPPENRLSSGSTLLNLACSGDPSWGLCKGMYFWMVGSSSSGKTFFTVGTLAEAARNKNFDDYDLVYDNSEDGCLMDLARYYGQKLADRIQPPAVDEDGEPIYSELVEDFYFNIDDRIKAAESGKGKPFIYLLDSMDSLSTKYEGDKFTEKKNARRKGTKAKGDYGDGKAKINSTYIRRVRSGLKKTGSILIILSQERDNIDAGLFEDDRTHAGGRSLKFYATWQLWSKVGGAIKRSVKGKERKIGVTSVIDIKKNRLTGKEWQVRFPIYFSVGIDNTQSMIDFLLEEKHWKKKEKSSVFKAPEFAFEGTAEELIKQIEEKNQEVELEELTTDVWREIERGCFVDRKPRYS